jgi:hypothetical protein
MHHYSERINAANKHNLFFTKIIYLTYSGKTVRRLDDYSYTPVKPELVQIKFSMHRVWQ